ncbi:CRISPR-associated protein Cas4 [Petroclostridium sp. X23]|uniref:CRISPR-associated protein Cas4 n=1 Tax=Petroclostridium sp. X23 TaxID=3045146 RepID=UPI0024ADCE74|nr:CRISPR-associated protein Cas4 [Petroclostridium sp. X23]WHH59322.1 CRISPR-associated protein Cas4 [Petroclostridium sp. X23]
MLTGTIVNYYFHCKRQCWLFYNKLNMEDNSEDVHIGRVLHELKLGEVSEAAIENVRLDKITPEYVIEMKKSDADVVAAKAQLMFYLLKLESKGIVRKGRLECLEKNKQDKKVHIVELTAESKHDFELLCREIEKFLFSPNPPAATKMNKCKKCAYYEYCFI